MRPKRKPCPACASSLIPRSHRTPDIPAGHVALGWVCGDCGWWRGQSLVRRCGALSPSIGNGDILADGRWRIGSTTVGVLGFIGQIIDPPEVRS